MSEPLAAPNLSFLVLGCQAPNFRSSEARLIRLFDKERRIGQGFAGRGVIVVLEGEGFLRGGLPPRLSL